MDDETPSSPLEYTSFADHEHVLTICFSFLADKDLTNVSSVCKLWSNIAYRDDIWFLLAQKRWHLPSILHKVTRPSLSRKKNRHQSSTEKRYDDKHHWFHSYKHLVETYKVPGGRFSGNGFPLCAISTLTSDSFPNDNNNYNNGTTTTVSIRIFPSSSPLSFSKSKEPATTVPTVPRLPQLWGWVSLISTDSCRIPHGKLLLPYLWLPSSLFLINKSNENTDVRLTNTSVTPVNTVHQNNDSSTNTNISSAGIFHHHSHHHSSEDSVLCDGCRIAQTIAEQVTTFTQRIIDSNNRSLSSSNNQGGLPTSSTNTKESADMANALSSIYDFPYSLGDNEPSSVFLQSFSFVYGGQTVPTTVNNTVHNTSSTSSTVIPPPNNYDGSGSIKNNSFHKRYHYRIPICVPVPIIQQQNHRNPLTNKSLYGGLESSPHSLSSIVTESIAYLNMKILVQNVGFPKKTEASTVVFNEIVIGIQGIRLIRRDGRTVYAHVQTNPCNPSTGGGNNNNNSGSSSRRNSQENLSDIYPSNNDGLSIFSASTMKSVPNDNNYCNNSNNSVIVAIDGNEIIPPVDNAVLPYLSYAVLRVCFPVLPDKITDNIAASNIHDYEYIYGPNIHRTTNRENKSNSSTSTTVRHHSTTEHDDGFHHHQHHHHHHGNEEEQASIPVFEPEGLESCGIIEIPLWEPPPRSTKDGDRKEDETVINSEITTLSHDPYTTNSSIPVFVPKLLGILRIPFLEEGKIWSKYRLIAGGLMIRVEREEL